MTAVYLSSELHTLRNVTPHSMTTHTIAGTTTWPFTTFTGEEGGKGGGQRRLRLRRRRRRSAHILPNHIFKFDGSFPLTFNTTELHRYGVENTDRTWVIPCAQHTHVMQALCATNLHDRHNDRTPTRVNPPPERGRRY